MFNTREVKALEQRLDRLEGQRGGRGCQVCGSGDDDGLTEYEVEFIYDDDEGDEEERCPACGETLVYTVTWDGL